MKEKLKFVIVSQSFTNKSYGVSILWLLNSKLNNLGYDSRIYSSTDNLFYITKDHCDVNYFFNKDDTIAIYTDSVIGDPLKAKFISYYLCANPISMGNDMSNFKENQFYFKYSNNITSNKSIPELFILDQLFLLNKKDKKVNQVCIYFGKTRKNKKFETNYLYNYLKNNNYNIYIIDRSFPNSKFNLYDNIKKSILFVSFDPLTNLSYEATLLGTPSLVLDDTYKQEIISNKTFSGIYFDIKHIENYNKRLIIDRYSNHLIKNDLNIITILEKMKKHFDGERQSINLNELKSEFQEQKFDKFEFVNINGVFGLLENISIKNKYISRLIFYGTQLLRIYNRLYLDLYKPIFLIKRRIFIILSYSTPRKSRIQRIAKLYTFKYTNLSNDQYHDFFSPVFNRTYFVNKFYKLIVWHTLKNNSLKS